MAKTGSYAWEGREKIRKELVKISIEDIREALGKTVPVTR